jgi:hypothetical protein
MSLKVEVLQELLPIGRKARASTKSGCVIADEAAVYRMAQTGLVKTESTQYQRTQVLSIF